MSLSMRFGKWGRGLLREGKWKEGEWAVWAKGGGKNRKYRSWQTEVNTAALPAVTHVLTFQNAWKGTSRRCVPGRVDSAKNNMFTTNQLTDLNSCLLVKIHNNQLSYSTRIVKNIRIYVEKKTFFLVLALYNNWSRTSESRRLVNMTDLISPNFKTHILIYCKCV